jgi:hypothetical protein
LPRPAEPVVGAAQVHELLTGWRRLLHGGEGAAVAVGSAADAG